MMDIISVITEIVICIYIIVGSCMITRAIVELYIAGRIRRKAARKLSIMVDAIPEVMFDQAKDLVEDPAPNAEKAKSFARGILKLKDLLRGVSEEKCES